MGNYFDIYQYQLLPFYQKSQDFSGFHSSNVWICCSRDIHSIVLTVGDAPCSRYRGIGRGC